MGKTVYYVAASLDGYIADPAGKLDWLFQFNEAEGVAERYQTFAAGLGAIAMGAATYEFVLGENMKEWPYAGLTTWVFTHRALRPFPGADLRFTDGDVGAVHAEMIAAARDKDVWLVGGGNLVAQFARRGLLDELLVTIVPVVLGGGAPLLPAVLLRPFELLGVTRLGMGMVELRYAIPR